MRRKGKNEKERRRRVVTKRRDGKREREIGGEGGRVSERESERRIFGSGKEERNGNGK